MTDYEVCKAQTTPIWLKSVYFTAPLKAVGCYYWGGRRHFVYSNLINRLALLIKDKVEKDNQILVIIKGPTSSGKSTLAIWIIIELCKLFGWPFVWEDVYLYSPEDLARKLERKCPNRINWFDEGSIAMDSLATTSRTGRLFSQWFNTMRLHHYISIVCTPEDSEIQGRITKHADLFIECPSTSPFPSQFKFQARGFFYVSTRTTYKSGKKWEDRIATGTYPKLTKKLKEEYEAIKLSRNSDFEGVFIKEVLGEC